MSRVPLSVFQHNNVCYRHFINTSTDTTTIEDINDKVLLTIDSSCCVYNEEGKQIGQITGWIGSHYSFKPTTSFNQEVDVKGTTVGPESHLDFEVLLFKKLVDLDIIKQEKSNG